MEETIIGIVMLVAVVWFRWGEDSPRFAHFAWRLRNRLRDR